MARVASWTNQKQGSWSWLLQTIHCRLAKQRQRTCPSRFLVLLLPLCYARWCPQSLHFLEPTGKILPFRGLLELLAGQPSLNTPKKWREYLRITS